MAAKVFNSVPRLTKLLENENVQDRWRSLDTDKFTCDGPSIHTVVILIICICTDSAYWKSPNLEIFVSLLDQFGAFMEILPPLNISCALPKGCNYKIGSIAEPAKFDSLC